METHVSTLLFLDGLVLKFKKPVCLPFLDMRSADRRAALCWAELHANSRLSPDVYLGVAEVRLAGAEPGAVLEHAVVMRRLPAGRRLSALAVHGAAALRPRLRRLAHDLAAFHAAAERSPDIDRAATAEALLDTWDRSMAMLRGSAALQGEQALLDHLQELAERFLHGRRALLEHRVATGKICDGHGDLLADDVYLLDDGPRILDCIEFDPGLRHVDVLADLAFLVMDLERLGAAAVGQSLLTLYLEASGDFAPAALFHYYCAQRALVRAGVAALRAAQRADGGADEVTSARRLLDLARHHLEHGRVVLGVVSGAPGTGKSTVAEQAGAALGWPVLRSDEIRRELVDPGGSGPLVGENHPGAYSTTTTERTYELLLERAGHALDLGQSVVLDATFDDPRWRRAVEDLGHRTDTDVVVIECRAPLPVAMERAARRLQAGVDPSGAGAAVAAGRTGRASTWPGAHVLNTDRLPPAPLAERAVHLMERPEQHAGVD